MSKKSFILYQEYKKNLSALSQSQKGDLLDAIFAYNEGVKIDLEPITNMAFSFIESDLNRNNQKYDNIVERNRINGSKGGRPPKPKKPSGLSGNPNKPKKADNGNGNDNGNDNKDDNKIKIPAFVKADLWNEFLRIRIKLKAVNSDLAITGILNKLEKFKAKGHDPNDLIQNSIEGSWKTVFEPRASKQTKTSGTDELLNDFINEK